MTETYYVVCDCGAYRSLYEGFGTETTPLGRCGGRRPWIGQYAREECEGPYRILVRTASNSYFPQPMRVISLPEVDRGLANKVTENYSILEALHDAGAFIAFRSNKALAVAFEAYSDDDVEREFKRQRAQLNSEVENELENVPVKVAEFAILNKGDSLIGEDDSGSDFHAETLNRDKWQRDSDSFFDGIENLVQVHRLREVVALLGFTRFESINLDKDGELDLGVQLAALDENITWLPAFENRGEGCLFHLGRRRLRGGWTALKYSHEERFLKQGGNCGQASVVSATVISTVCPM